MCVYVPVQSTITNKKAIKREHRHETEREKGTKLRYTNIAYSSLTHLDTNTPSSAHSVIVVVVVIYV